MVINGITVTDCIGCSDEEIKAYIKHVEKCTNGAVTQLTIEQGEEGVRLDYVVKKRKFERIRRITGYLVGTIDRWNDAKKAEESQRVKHL